MVNHLQSFVTSFLHRLQLCKSTGHVYVFWFCEISIEHKSSLYFLGFLFFVSFSIVFNHFAFVNCCLQRFTLWKRPWCFHAGICLQNNFKRQKCWFLLSYVSVWKYCWILKARGGRAARGCHSRLSCAFVKSMGSLCCKKYQLPLSWCFQTQNFAVCTVECPTSCGGWPAPNSLLSLMMLAQQWRRWWWWWWRRPWWRRRCCCYWSWWQWWTCCCSNQ